MKPPAYAIQMAEQGIPVFPCSAKKRPCCENGFYDATTDRDELDALWRKSPGPLIGTPTGPVTGLDLLDIDPRHGGLDWLDEFVEYLPATRTVQTRSGGTHFFYQHRPGMRNSESKIADGVDVRGAGGYVILWVASGGYVVRDLPVVAWPDWLAEIATRPAEKPAPTLPASTAPLRPMKKGKAEEIAFGIIGRELLEVESAPPGQRHHRVRDAARTIGGLIEQLDISTEDAAQKLYEAVQRAGAENLQGAYKTICWGLTVGRTAPLTIGAPR